LINITNEDNMELMSRYEDNHFDLAIVDPPYGINMSKYLAITKPSRPNSYFYKQKHKTKEWDNVIPAKKYFNELFRVSKNQIIWGGNYFTDFLKPTNSWIFWDKINGEGSTFSDGELAWNSFKKALRKFTVSTHHGTRGGKDRIHPTQKPVKLYEWLLMNYAKEGDKILDTHLGSGSIAIACHNLGFDLTACEIDKEYYEAAMKRIEQHKQQKRLF
tara:strand:+ start:733 stop:1380 length:648 start_codon:yes stop_codon:yes gene_type:complete